jgi:hypothetical protein
MSRLSAIALALATALMVAACADNILKERPAAKATSTATPPSFSVSGAAAKRQSTVCAAYRRQLKQIQNAQVFHGLEAQKEQLKARELSLNAVIADACE